MAIDIFNEELLKLSKIPANLERRTSERLNVSTVYRWINRGIAGIRLETILVGGCRYTSTQALNRFFTQSTLAKERKHTEATAAEIRRTNTIRKKQLEQRAKQQGL
jgi:hypothetical protein